MLWFVLVGVQKEKHPSLNRCRPSERLFIHIMLRQLHCVYFDGVGKLHPLLRIDHPDRCQIYRFVPNPVTENFEIAFGDNCHIRLAHAQTGGCHHRQAMCRPPACFIGDPSINTCRTWHEEAM
jgi:hypothetical protein